MIFTAFNIGFGEIRAGGFLAGSALSFAILLDKLCITNDLHVFWFRIMAE
jgi:hypothetical protein